MPPASGLHTVSSRTKDCSPRTTAFLNDVVADIGDQGNMRAVLAERPGVLTWGSGTGRPEAEDEGWDQVEIATIYTWVDGLIDRHWQRSQG